MTDKPRNAALKAIMGQGAAKPAAEPARADAQTQPAPAPASDTVAPARDKVVELRQTRPAAKKAVAKVMLYLPPKVAKKFKEMAFHEDCKAHDLYIAALADFLRDRGHAAEAELLSREPAN